MSIAPPLIRPADAPVFDLPGVQFTGLAAPSRGAQESSVWIVRVAAGTPGMAHQLTREEVLIVLEGRARATLRGCEYDLEPGSAFVIPARTDFALANPYAAPFRAVAVLPVGGQAIVGADTFTPPWAQ
jgi:mannose-6-phosphate isomerase-like protein (cupin superfamily)